MSTYVVRRETEGATFYNDVGQETRFDKCGTAACIAGWACLIQAKGDPNIDDIAGTAKRLLELGPKQAEHLFCTGLWPGRFEYDYDRARSQKERAEIAADRINHFIATKGKE